MASECTKKILGRLDSDYFLSVYPHNSAVCHNLKSIYFPEEGSKTVEFFSDVFSKFPYRVSYPTPCSFPSVLERKVINGIDTAQHLVKAKRIWEDYKNQILKFCDKKDAEKYAEGLESEAEYSEVPKNVLLLVKHLEKDPDQYFNANYNTYFSGGNVSCVDVGSKKYLLTPTTSDDGFIAATKLYDNGSQWDVDYKSCFQADTEIPGIIYQIEASKDVVLVRQKHCITVFSVGNKDIYLNSKFRVNKDYPFYSVCVNGSDFCTISANGELETFDAVTKKTVVKNNLSYVEDDTGKSDKWKTAYYVDNKTVCLLDRSSVSLLDLRIKNGIAGHYLLSEAPVEHCEELMTGCLGSRGVHYFVTSHQVLCLDPRQGFTHRWTHGIAHSPSVIASAILPQWQDTLFIGSQRNDNVVIIENAWNGDTAVSKFHPYVLPSLSETLHLARFNGCCLSNSITSRFDMSLTGLCCLENRDSITLIRLTSAVDIFKQTVMKGCSDSGRAHNLSELELTCLEQWEGDCEQIIPSSACYVTDLLDDEHLLTCLMKDGEEYEEDEENINFDNAKWKISKKELESCCDYLAPRILEEWGLEGEEEWGEAAEEGKQYASETTSEEEDDIMERVSAWIEQYSRDTTEHPSTSEKLDAPILERTHVLGVAAHSSKEVLPTPNPPNSKDMTVSSTHKKKRYITGF